MSDVNHDSMTSEIQQLYLKLVELCATHTGEAAFQALSNLLCMLMVTEAGGNPARMAVLLDKLQDQVGHCLVFHERQRMAEAQGEPAPPETRH